ncbi:MAG: NAD(P)H-dependent oxidoreductase subunit E, partial [Victivallales bacterium]
HVYGVATFYAHFSLNPKGKHIFKLCDGTACHVKKSHGILEALYEKLGLSKEKNTTDDMLFTVETVSCLGACGLAPVMLVNDQVYGQVTPEQAEKIVDELRETEKNAQERNMENE